MSKHTGASLITEMFKRIDLTHIFFVPAIATTALVEMEKVGIKRITTHSEKAAAYMADGYARVKQAPGVCMSQSVGAANLAAGLQDAYLGSSPVIAITGKKPPIAQHRNAYQEINHTLLFEPVTKFNVSVESAKQLDYLLPQAINRALSGRPRPVHLDLNGYEGDLVCREEVDSTWINNLQVKTLPGYRLVPQLSLLDQAAELLKNAQKPVVVAGRGVLYSRASIELQNFIEKTGIPLVVSVDAKGCIPENHKLYHGCVGSYGRKSANTILMESDLVLFIGCGTGDQVTNMWTLPKRKSQIIQIDIEPEELGRNYINCLGIPADAKLALEGLINLIEKPCPKAWTYKAAQFTYEWNDKVKIYRESDDLPILPERLCAEIESFLPVDAILVADTGYSAVWSANQINLNHKEQKYIRAAGSLGWALPAAIGAQCAAPDKQIICFLGDGAFLYHLPELETAARWNIPLIVIINNNSRYGQSQNGANKAYGENKGKRGDIFQLNNLNFAKIAENFGCIGFRVENPSELRNTFDEALHQKKPVVIDVVTDGNHLAPWHKPDEDTFLVN